MLPILYRDDELVAIDKPSGLLVHPNALSRDRRSAMSILRDQLGQRVYPVHRLDRGASGVLLFALTPEAARELMGRFREKQVRKTYFALVRGYVPESGVIDKALGRSEGSTPTEARSSYECAARVELPEAVGRYPTSRYSLARVTTETGRFHQVRKHLRSIDHPVIGDTWYGDGRHNRFFRERFGIHRLLLMAMELALPGLRTGEELRIRASWPEEVQALFKTLGWDSVIEEFRG